MSACFEILVSGSFCKCQQMPLENATKQKKSVKKSQVELVLSQFPSSEFAGISFPLVTL